MALTAPQIDTIRSTAPVLEAHGNTITSRFYATMLKENPDLNNVFNQTNQRNGHQAQALAGSLYAYATHIDDLGALAPAVERICIKHASLYIKPEQYEIVGTYLLRAMGEVLGDALTPEILEAWTAAYGQLAGLMINREEQIYADSNGWRNWREFRIADKVKESEVITSFYLEPVDGQKLPLYLPGQYLSLLVDVPELGYVQSRQYSLSDAPRTDRYRVSIKKEMGLGNAKPEQPGVISNIMHDDKQVGDVIKVSHPAGEFFWNPESDANDSEPIVLLSAGVGITPMMSILNTAVSKNPEQRASFVHGSRTTAAKAFGNDIKEIVAQHPNVTASIFVRTPNLETDVAGLDYHHASRVKLESLHAENDLCLHDKRARYFVCGPENFMDDVSAGLKDRGVDGAQIRMEVFGTGDIQKP